MLLVGLAVVVSIFWSFIRLRKGLVIDQAGEYICKGDQLLVGYDSPLAKAEYARRMPVDEVHAVQLISEFITPDAMESYMIMSNDSETEYDQYQEIERRTFFSYELNLVLSTGERITVMDHHRDDEIREAGQKIATMLDVPIWDVIGDDDYIHQCCCLPKRCLGAISVTTPPRRKGSSRN